MEHVQEVDAAGVSSMFSLSPDAVLGVDPRGTIRQVNEHAASLFRTSMGQLEGSNVDELLPDHLRRLHAHERASFHDQPSVRTMGTGRQLLAQRPDGSEFPADISLQPISVEGERLVLAVVRDLTQHMQLIEANRQLAADAASLRRFVNVASHELRTPLTSVRGFAELLVHGRVSITEQQEVLERILRNAVRQEQLIAGLLDLARLQEGKISVRPALVEVSAAAVDALDALGDGHVTLEVEPGLVVRADPLRLTQVLVNLLSNAFRYGEPPVQLTSSRVASAWARIAVTDHGPGVSDGFADSMFDPFAQDSVGDRREASGLGLGLHIARELVEAMDGTLRYRPTVPTGATFEVLLPAA